MIQHILMLAVVLAQVFGFGVRLFAEETPAPPAVTYEQHILPLMREKCGSCHNANDKKGGLVVDNYGALLRGGGSGEAVKTNGDFDGSVLYRVLAHLDEPFMPPQQPRLPDDQLAMVKKWIELGAPQNSGSKVKLPKTSVGTTSVASSIKRPDGPAPMPEGLSIEPLLVTPRATSVRSLAVNPWSPLVAVGGYEQVLLYHTGLKELVGILPFPEGTAYSLRFSRNGSVLLAGGGRGARHGKVILWDVRSGKRLAELGDEYDVVLAADISPDHSLVALGGPKKMVRVYSTSTGELQYELKKHTDWVTAIEFSPDGVLLSTGDRSNGLIVWEAATGQEFYALSGHKGAITEVSWSADSNVLASASEDGQVRLWTMHDGKGTKTIAAHGGGVTSVRFVRDGRLVTAGRDRAVKLWKSDGNQQVAFSGLSDLPTRVTFDAETETVLAGELTGLVKTWQAAGAPLEPLTSNPLKIEARQQEVKEALARVEARYTQAAERVAELQKLQVARQEQAETAKRQLDDAQNRAKTSKIDFLKSENESKVAMTALTDRRNELKEIEKSLGAVREAHQKSVKGEQVANEKHRAALASTNQLKEALAKAEQLSSENENDGSRQKLDEAKKKVMDAEKSVQELNDLRMQAMKSREAAEQSLKDKEGAVAAVREKLKQATATNEASQKKLDEWRITVKTDDENLAKAKLAAAEVGKNATLSNDEKKSLQESMAVVAEMEAQRESLRQRLQRLVDGAGRPAAQ